MREFCLASRNRAPVSIAAIVAAAAFFAIVPAACSNDLPNTTAPLSGVTSGPVRFDALDANPIVVSNAAELMDALDPANSGRRIHVLAGTYNVSQPLNVPDDVTLEGEGVMLSDATGWPTGFSTGTRTTLTMTANTPGNVLTLGDGVTVRGIAIEDLAGRVGNAIGVVSRGAGDSVSTTITNVEIVNPNSHTIVPAGPAGCGIVVLTLNPNLGAAPAPHEGAAVRSRITHSLIHSTATGTACGLFAFNFAPLANVSVAVADNVVGGGIIVNGGVSRPDPVHDSRTTITSHRNLYRNHSPNACAPQRLGWNSTGGSGTPAPLQVGATERNLLRIQSLDDRIEGFTTGIFATGGRRFFAGSLAGPSTGNSIDMNLIGTTISTPSCGGASFVADLRIAGATVADASMVPGDGNTVSAVIRGVTGSGTRSNVYADVLGPTGPLTSGSYGTGNRLLIAGSARAFEQTNDSIDPAPGFAFFSGNK